LTDKRDLIDLGFNEKREKNEGKAELFSDLHKRNFK